MNIQITDTDVEELAGPLLSRDSIGRADLINKARTHAVGIESNAQIGIEFSLCRERDGIFGETPIDVRALAKDLTMEVASYLMSHGFVFDETTGTYYRP